MNSSNANPHQAVLINEVVDLLSPTLGDSYLDLTAGYGGHATAISSCAHLSSVTLVDRDIAAVDYLGRTFDSDQIVHSDSGAFTAQAHKDGQSYDMILADLGISSVHVDDHSRGFSFSNQGPLDMRMDTRQELTAASVVNEFPQDQIANILYRYGEMKNSRKIAAEIVAGRPYKNTSDLSSRISKVIYSKSKNNPATLVFQAIRIYVNDELGQLSTLLEYAPKLLNPGGRLAIISFHSLEDRMVKIAFSELGQDTLDSSFRNITKKPIVPSKNETVLNPRARSAKLRVLQRK